MQQQKFLHPLLLQSNGGHSLFHNKRRIDSVVAHPPLLCCGCAMILSLDFLPCSNLLLMNAQSAYCGCNPALLMKYPDFLQSSYRTLQDQIGIVFPDQHSLHECLLMHYFHMLHYSYRTLPLCKRSACLGGIVICPFKKIIAMDKNFPRARPYKAVLRYQFSGTEILD